MLMINGGNKMKKMTRIISMIFLAILLLLVACGPDRSERNNSTTNNSDENPEKPKELIIGLAHEPHQVEVLENIFDSFTEETGIKVKTIKDMETEKLSLDAPAGNGPDLFFSFHDRTGDLLSQGLVAPIELTEDIKADYVEESINAMTYGQQLYAIPQVIEASGLIYNKELINDDEVPTTLVELEEIGRERTDKENDEFGFLLEVRNAYFAYPFMTSEGGYIFNQSEDGDYDVNDIGLANEETVSSLKRYQGWMEEGFLPREIGDGTVNGLFEEGKVDLIVHLPRQLLRFHDVMGEENVGVAPLPKTDDGKPLQNFMGVKGWYISAYSENKKWATELALYLTNPETSKKYFEEAREIPANTEMYESDLVQKDELLGGFAEQLKYAVPMPNVPEMTTTWDPMKNALQYISEGDDPKEVMEEAIDIITEQIQLQK